MPISYTFSKERSWACRRAFEGGEGTGGFPYSPSALETQSTEGGLRVGSDIRKCHEGGDIVFKGGLRVGWVLRRISKGGLDRPITR